MSAPINRLIIKRAKLREKIQLLHSEKMKCQDMFFCSKRSKEQYYWSVRIEAIQSVLADLDQEYDELDALFIKSTQELSP